MSKETKPQQKRRTALLCDKSRRLTQIDWRRHQSIDNVDNTVIRLPILLQQLGTTNKDLPNPSWSPRALRNSNQLALITVAQIPVPNKRRLEEHSILEGLSKNTLPKDMVEERIPVHALARVVLFPLREGSVGGGKEGAGLAAVDEGDETVLLEMFDED